MHKLIFLLLAIFLTACGPRKFSVNDNYIDVPSTASAFQQTSSPDSGYFYTRTVGNMDKVNKPWSGTVTTEGSRLYVLDFGLELQQQRYGNYYRIHLYPQHQSPLKQVSAWIEITLNRGEKKDANPLVIYAQLPDDVANTTGAIVTNWFSCEACLSGREADFKSLAATASKTSDLMWYEFVTTPKTPPEWNGDTATREAAQQAQRQKRQQVLAELEASMPPAVLRDKYMIQLSTQLKQQQFEAALPLFEKLEALPGQADPSLQFFYGEALLKTAQPAKALEKLYGYISSQGTQSTHYAKALELINQAESQLP